MARTARSHGPRPPALPPETRTVGQVVAETLRLYGSRFWVSLPLGVPLAIADQVSFERPLGERTAILLVLAPLFTLAYAWACAIERGARPPARQWVVALCAGTLVFLPAAATLGWFVLLAVAWLGLAGWIVPVAMNEEAKPLDAARRAKSLGLADPVHAIGGIATLVLVFGLTRQALAWLLREQADNTVRASVLLADLVLSPIVYLGAAVLYRDLVARVGRTRDERRRLRDAAAQ